jgi:hypothetical protein
VISGQYFHTSQSVNRVYVVGTDDKGNPVYGETDSVSGLEVPVTVYKSTIKRTADANKVAINMFSKSRLSSDCGEVMTRIHPGLEVGDVIEFTDDPCNQSDNAYRVKQIRNVINTSASPKFHHTIGLTEV